MIPFEIPVWVSKTYPVKRVAEQTFQAFQVFYLTECEYKHATDNSAWKPQYIRIGDASQPKYQKEFDRYVRFSNNTFTAYTTLAQAKIEASTQSSWFGPDFTQVKPIEIVKGSTYYVNSKGIVTASHMRLVDTSERPLIPELSRYERYKGIFLHFIDWLLAN